MHLTQFRHQSLVSDWQVSHLRLQPLNLVVGQNAVGKSRTLQAIQELGHILRGDDPLGSFRAVFEEVPSHDKTATEVAIEVQVEKKPSHGVVGERLWVNQRLMLERANRQQARLWDVQADKWDEGFPPEDRLAMTTNRDTVKHPYLESIVAWADGLKVFSFNAEESRMMRFHMAPSLRHNGLGSIGEVFHQLSPERKQTVIDGMRALEYRIEDARVEASHRDIRLFLREEGITQLIEVDALSQGMFRALATMAYLQYLAQEARPFTLLIDDLCEGLDYQRAKQLGKWVFDLCHKSNIQLIASSNDSFLMEVVDIGYWNILYREGNMVRSISALNQPDLFEQFRYTGLSNFDLLSSDFISQHFS